MDSVHSNLPNHLETTNRSLSSSKVGALQHASSSPNGSEIRSGRMHHKHHTVTNLYHVPSKIHKAHSTRHRQNVSKASKILGIHSNAVILANSSRRKRRRPHYNASHRQTTSLFNVHDVRNGPSRSTIGLNSNGLRSNGLNPNALNSNALNPNDVNATGLNPNGLSSNGLNPNGLSSNGLNPNRLNDMKMIEDEDDGDEFGDDDPDIYAADEAKQDGEEWIDDEEDQWDDDELSDDEMDAQLKFDKFRPQKRSSNTGRLLMRSATVDLTESKASNQADTAQRNSKIHRHSPQPPTTMAPKPSIHRRHQHQRGITTLNVGDHSGLHDDHHLNPFSANRMNRDHGRARPSMQSSSRRHRLSMSKSMSESTSDVIEIKLRIDATKRGYLFIGILPANKINVVVQPGFMFGFNAFSHSLHGFSGKLYHDGVQSEYCFSQNNALSKRKNSGSRQRTLISNGNGHGNQLGNNTVNAVGSTATTTASPSTATSNNAATAATAATVAAAEDLVSTAAGTTLTASGTATVNGVSNVQSAENERKINNDVINNFRENEEATTSTVSVAQHHRNGQLSAHKNLPVLQSGDIVTVKMRLNRNNGKFAVIYCINNVDYGVAWKAIDPPVTVGITMVGRSEQITLLSCTYRPHKNDKSCVIL